VPNPIRVLVVIADTHSGSTLAPCPPDMDLHDGAKTALGPIQRWLYGCANDFIERWVPSIVGEDDYALLCNGDATEGVHHKSVQVYSTEPMYHARIFTEMWGPLFQRAARRFMVIGTECHVHAGEGAIGKALGCERNQHTGDFAAQHWPINIAGCDFSARHHIGTTTREWLEATQLSATLAAEQLSAVRSGGVMPKVVHRAHRHRFGTYSNGKEMLTVSPPWQIKTTHAHKVVPDAYEEVGGCIYDWRGLPDGSLPKLHTKLYQAGPTPGVIL
jgi:hypothetical protein